MNNFFSTHFTLRHFAVVPNINLEPLFMEAQHRFRRLPIRVDRYQGLIFLTEASDADTAVEILKVKHPDLFESSTYDTLPVESPDTWGVYPADSSVIYLRLFHTLLLGNRIHLPDQTSSVVIEQHPAIMETFSRTNLLWQPAYPGKSTPSLHL